MKDDDSCLLPPLQTLPDLPVFAASPAAAPC
jgi:hypothetical protein